MAQILQDRTERRGADASADDDGAVIAIEDVRRRGKRPIETDAHRRSSVGTSQLAQSSRPVAGSGADVQRHLLLVLSLYSTAAAGDGEGMPLPPTDLRHLQQHILPRLERHEAWHCAAVEGQTNRRGVDDVQGGCVRNKAASVHGSMQFLEKDEEHWWGKDDAQDGELEQSERPVGHHEADC
ncbi:hypothetical protein L7F22_034908 [Adiantum nelumboides]|nr:hypothetical protein [Adiantum nelumboides]